MIVCKYKFDSSVYSNLIPIFNDGYTGYTISDEIDSENSNHVIRTIKCDVLPTSLRFTEAKSDSTGSTGRESALIEVYEIDNTKLNTEVQMFHLCGSLIKISGLHSNVIHDSRYMFCGCSNLRIIEGIENWDTSKVTNMGYMFHACNNLTSLDVSNWDTSNVTIMNHMFYNCTNLTSLDVSFNTSNVTRMDYMFYNCTNLTSLDVSNFDTSNVTNMNSMFYHCTNLTSLDVSNFDTSKVTNMSWMFLNCNKLTSLNVSNFNTKNVTTMYGMFSNCNKLTSLDVSNFNTSNVTNISRMFHHCEKVQVLDVSNFDTSNVTDMYAMFWNCISLTSLNLSNFDISNVTNLGSMIGGCSNLTELNINNIGVNDSNINDDRLLKNDNNLSKLYCNDTITLSYLMNTLCDRISATQGELVTTLELDDEITTNLTAKNWIVKKLVAQYKYDANTYDNLIPEFNTEFSSDMYEIYDSVSEIVIDNIKWEDGSLNQENGENHNKDDRMRVKNYIPVIPNVTYKEIGADRFSNVCWYDKDKKFISYEDGLTLTRTSPNNAYFMRLFTTTERHSNVSISAKLITRSIESVNGDLPTLMRFGLTEGTSATETSDRELCLLKVHDMSTTELTTGCNMFRCNNCLQSIKCNWNTGKMNNMSAMFQNCRMLSELDVSNWNTSNVTSMANMFDSCNNLTSLDVSNWNTSNVISMLSMFEGCKNLTSLNVSNFDTSNVTTMNSMFLNCNKLTSLNVSNFNTKNVTTMYGMFSNCNKLTSLDVSNFNTSNVTDMSFMFWKCAKLKLLILSNWNFSKVTSIYRIFSTNTNVKMSLETLDIANWEISDSTNTENLFYIDDESLTSIKNIRCNNANVINNVILPNIPTRSSDNKGQVITSAELSQEIIDALASKNWTVVSNNTLTKVAEYVYDSKIWNSMLPEFNDEFVEYFIDDVEDENGLVTRTISSMGGLPTLMRFGTPYIDVEYVEGSELALLEVLDMNTNNITDMYAMFRRCYNLTSINCTWNTSKIKSMYVMFYNCTKLTSLDVSNFDTSNVTNMWSAFSNCHKLTSLDVSNFDTSNVTNMKSVFSGCINLTSLDVSNWDTSNVTNMWSIFSNCNKLTSLDVSNWNTSNVTTMYNMFANCSKLISLDLSNFNTNKVTNFTNIFSNTPLLKDIGMLYCTQSTINTIASVLPTTRTQTIWVQDTKPSECTVVSGVEFKEYKENSVMINLSSPLLQGDRIEVKDGKLCHYHKMGKVVLDGSEDENYRFSTWLVGLENLHRIYYLNDSYDSVVSSTLIKSNNFRTSNITNTAEQNYECIGQNETYNASIQFNISKSKLSTQDVDGFKQWLSENPTTVVYELAEPYYEDVTPIQSKLTLETYLECNLDIYTNLPIKTNLTYLTNITNTSSIEEEINTINEGTDLTNLLEDEINN